MATTIPGISDITPMAVSDLDSHAYPFSTNPIKIAKVKKAELAEAPANNEMRSSLPRDALFPKKSPLETTVVTTIKPTVAAVEIPAITHMDSVFIGRSSPLVTEIWQRCPPQIVRDC
ncbi:MAG: hypothetical protein QME66_13780 [Candidatus Eisenbacteria bacterium]|nr:hypothetical protein [Candidatus Eisenbacteria bacterium]